MARRWTQRPWRRRAVERCEDRLCLAVSFDIHQVTASESNNPADAFAADLDGDGDLDGLSISTGDGKIAWYRNLDGKGHFGPQIVVSHFPVVSSTFLAPPATVFAGDLDRDGDQDIVWSAWSDNGQSGHLAWHENLDGLGTFGETRPLANVPTLSIQLADLTADGFNDLVLGKGWLRNVNGRGDFGAFTSFPTSLDDTYEGLATRVTDLDGDGDLDLAMATQTSITWLENTDGRGTLRRHPRLNSANAAITIATGDFDADGDSDIVSSSYYHSMAWYENTGGTPRFAPPRGMNNRSTSLHTGDVDRDGDVDILSNFGWWENTDGRGTFRLAVYDASVEFNRIYPADIDADGDLDLMTIDLELDEVSWLENTNGRGSFLRHAPLAATGHPAADSVQAADLDGDGDMDLLAAGFSQRLAWYEHLDDGTFSPPRIISSIDSQPQIADMDADGDLDIVNLCNCDASLSWLENEDGRGKFGPARRLANEYGQMALEIVDYDLDQDLDLITIFDPSGFRAPTVVQLRRNLGNRTFAAPETLATLPGNFFETYALLEATDIDRDGDWDLLLNIAGALNLFRNPGNGPFDPPIPFAFGQEATMALEDIDADGDSDLLLANIDANTILWRENVDGRGQYGESKLIAANVKNPRPPQLTDLDGDGDRDLAVVLLGSGEAVWFEHLDGRGAFGPKQILATSRIVSSLHAADLDRDGDVDVAFASRSDDAIAWLENLRLDEEPMIGDANNDGAFNSADLIAVFQAGEYEDTIDDNSTFAEGDWNGDGDFNSSDLVLAFQAGTYVTSAQRKVLR